MQWVLDPIHQSGSLLDHVITREASSAVLDKLMVLDLVSDHRLILFGIPKHQAPGRTTMVRFGRWNNISAQVIQYELSDVFKLCQETNDPNAYLKIANKTQSIALDRMAPEKESLKPWHKSGPRGRWKPVFLHPTLNRTRRHTNMQEMYISLS